MVSPRGGASKAVVYSGCRAYTPAVAGPIITGLMFFFAMIAHSEPERSIAFTLPDHYIEKSKLGLRRRPKITKGVCDAVRFDDQYCFQVGVGYIAARQRAIELAMGIDEDCAELGLTGLPLASHRGVAIGIHRCIGLAQTTQRNVAPL